MMRVVCAALPLAAVGRAFRSPGVRPGQAQWLVFLVVLTGGLFGFGSWLSRLRPRRGEEIFGALDVLGLFIGSFAFVTSVYVYFIDQVAGLLCVGWLIVWLVYQVRWD
jgi:hypothetical protein